MTFKQVPGELRFEAYSEDHTINDLLDAIQWAVDNGCDGEVTYNGVTTYPSRFADEYHVKLSELDMVKLRSNDFVNLSVYLLFRDARDAMQFAMTYPPA